MGSTRRGRWPHPAAPTSDHPNNQEGEGSVISEYPNSYRSPPASKNATEQDIMARSLTFSGTAYNNNSEMPCGPAPLTEHWNTHASLEASGITVINKSTNAGDSQVYMALDMKNNSTVGCAYFVATTATMYLRDETRVVGLELVESIIFQAQPTAIIVPSRAPAVFVTFLERLRGEVGENGGGDDQERGFVLRSVVSSDFNAEHGRQLLARLDFPDNRHTSSAIFTTAVDETEEYNRTGDIRPERGEGSSSRNNLMNLGTFINLDDQVSVSYFTSHMFVCTLTQHTMWPNQTRMSN